MALHTEDMSQIADQQEVAPEGWYHVRVSKVEEVDSKAGNPMINLQLKVQTEGPFFGRMLFDNPSLLPNALFKLKAYYKAAGYTPGPEGHDPEKLLDREFYVGIVHKMYEGAVRSDIKPFNIRSLQDGPGKPIGAGK